MNAKSLNENASASALRRFRQLFVAVLVVAATLAGCASDELDTTACDAPVTYRVSQVRWPADHEAARVMGFDLNSDKLVDNQLGQLAVSLDNYFVDPFDLSAGATAHVTGDVGWELQVQQCPGDRAAITVGSGEPLVGTLIDGTYDVRGESGVLPLAALFDPSGATAGGGWRESTASALRLTVVGDELVGDVGMAPSQDDVTSAVVDAMTRFVDSRSSLQPELLDVFDTDHDGTISYSEISESTLTKSLLAADLSEQKATSLGVAIVAQRR